MNWRDFLLLATRLAAGTSQSEWRTAISRAYYAAFHVARNLLTEMGFSIPRADRAHQYLVFRLSNCGQALIEQSGPDLETLRRLRNRADYDEFPAITQPQAAAAARMAEAVVQELDKARQEPGRTNARDVMIIYERDVLRDVTWHP